MIHVLKSFAAKVWAGVILLVVVTGLLVGGLRLGLPLVTEYREQLAADLSEVMQAPVRIERLDARLAGLSPELRLSGVEIFDPADDNPLLRFDELRLRVDLTDSLLSGEPRVELATIIGARLIIRRQPDGQVFLIGLDADKIGADTRISPAPFLSQGRLRLQGGEIVWDNRRFGAPPVRFVDVEAQLLNAGARHQFDIKGRIADAGESRGELRADFFGDPGTPLAWSGDIYFKGSGLALEPLSEQLLPSRYHVDAQAEVELWSHWSQGRGGTVAGRVVLSDLQLAGDPAGSGLDRIAGWLDWRREAGGWLLGLKGLVMEHDGRVWPGADLAVRVHDLGDAGTRVQFGAGRLWLEDLAAAGRALPIAGEWRRLLQELLPRGELQELRLDLMLPEAGEVSWQGAGRVEGFNLAPRGDVPGVSGLDLSFRADQDHGVVQLASDGLELRFTDLFRWTLRADRLSGELVWQPGAEGGVEIRSEEIVLETPDLKTRSRLLLRLGPNGGGNEGVPPFLDMQTDFSDGDGANASLYLPSGILSAELVKWLDRAIVSGRATSGTFLFRGPLDAYPFRGREGRFEVLFGVEQGILDYQEGWPRLEELSAEIRFLNEGLEARLYDGRLLESQVEESRVRIADLGGSPLTIDGGVRGPFADTFRILRETPLAQRQARYVHGMQAEGESRVDLDLSIPLNDKDEYRVDGRLRWDSAALQLPDWGLTLDRLKGALAFTDEGVFAKRVQARLWGDPVRLDVDTFPARREGPGRTRIGVDLKLRPQRLADRYPHWLWSQLQGTASGRLLLDVGHTEGGESDIPLSFQLDSKLAGINVTLPTPLAKATEETRHLHIEGRLPLAPGGSIGARYGDIAGTFRLAAAAKGGLTLDGAQVRCGSERAPYLEGPGFRLTGRLTEVDLAAWVRWLSDHGPYFDSHGDADRQRPSQRVDLLIDKLLLPKGVISNLQLGMVRTPNAWEVELAADQLHGSVRLPDDLRSNPVSVELQSLRLDLDTWELEPGAAADAASWPDPRQAPGLFVSVEELYLGGREFGRLNLKALPVPDGLRLEQLALDGPLITLQGSGAWSGTPTDQQTRLILEAQSPDLGRVTRELQFTTAIEQAEMDMKADLHWRAPPSEVNLGNLAGALEFHLAKGRVLDVNPGVGRIFGLLNLGALQRRLTLDFSDLFGKGYAFDRIDGSFTLGGGVAEARQVSIAGPSANLDISGSAGLLARDYDQVVTVTPEISVTLPLAGAIVGGPVVAAALVVAEQVMGEEVNKLIRYQYRVTGPWSDPQIVRIETEDGWSLSNLLRPANERAQAQPSGPAVEEGGFFVH